MSAIEDYFNKGTLEDQLKELDSQIDWLAEDLQSLQETRQGLQRELDAEPFIKETLPDHDIRSRL